MIAWRPWSDDVLEHAQRRAKPVLLYLKAPWCRWCRQFEHAVLDDVSIGATVEACFTPVAIDVERRPELAARYSHGSWPALAFLDEHGELLACEGYMGVAELLARLDLVAGHWTERAALRRRIHEASDRAAPGSSSTPSGAARDGELPADAPADVAQRLVASADPHFGGWGAEAKFPHSPALEFLIARWSRSGDEACRQVVLRTLRCMQEGAIHDPVEGGFYRYSSAPDWSAPHYEKLLEHNARRLEVYVEAHQAFGEASFARTANRVVDWLCSTLLDERTGAFKASQDADPLYARRESRRERRELRTPACDPTLFADSNASAVGALLRAATVLERPECESIALRTLDFITEEMCDEHGGAHHYHDGTRRLPGLLRDQAFVLRALLDAAQYAGQTQRLEAAQRLAESCLRTLACAAGGFWDMRADPCARGALLRRTRPVEENGVLAQCLLRLAHMTADARWAAIARSTLSSLGGEYRRAGHQAASYAHAVDLALHAPVHVVITACAGSREELELRRAALGPYVAGRIVQTLDPLRDRRWMERLDVAASATARAFVSRGRESYAQTDDPRRLPALLTRVEPAA